MAALRDHEFVRKSVLHNSQELEKIYQRFHEQGIPFTESQGNFVMFDTLRNVREVHEGLLRKRCHITPYFGLRLLRLLYELRARLSLDRLDDFTYSHPVVT